MLTIRVGERLWKQARDAERLLTDLRFYLNKHPHWVWNQSARYRAAGGTWRLGAVRPVMLSTDRYADLKLVLRRSNETGIDYLVVALRRARPAERYEMMTGRNLQGERFQLLRPTDKIEDVMVVIKPDYTKLPQFQRSPIVHAWDRLVHGMQQRKVRMGQDIVFWLQGVVDRRALQELDAALTDASVGRVSSDPYETRRAREMCEEYGQPCD